VNSGEFGCWMVFVSFLVKNSRIMMALCDGANYHGAKSTSCKKSKTRAEVDVLKTV